MVPVSLCQKEQKAQIDGTCIFLPKSTKSANRWDIYLLDKTDKKNKKRKYMGPVSFGQNRQKEQKAQIDGTSIFWTERTKSANR